MGGYGSGRSAIRPALDGGLRLDLYRLIRDGLVKPDCHAGGTLTWSNTRTGAVLATIGFTVDTGMEGGTLRLRYTSTSRATRERVESDHCIRLTSTPQPFGGRRWWFLCPDTGDKSAKEASMIYRADSCDRGAIV